MSISRCPYCEMVYDQDFNAEHEEVCKEERESKEFRRNPGKWFIDMTEEFNNNFMEVK